MSKIKNFVFDLDGTLLNKQSLLSQRTQDYLKNLKEIKMFIATGRPWFHAIEFHSQLNLKTPIISNNGGLVYDIVNNKPLLTASFKFTTAKDILNIIIKHQVPVFINTPKVIYLWCPKNVYSPQMEHTLKIWKTFDTWNDYPAINWDEKYCSPELGALKFVMAPTNNMQEQMQKVMDEVNQKYSSEVYIVDPGPGYMDIMPIGFSKGSGLLFLEQNNYLDKDQTIVFGDAENDVSMFSLAKYSVAMPQSNESVKKAATHVANFSASDDIIVDFLENHLNLWKV
ncbi:Cof-type HAD-IIB family hydrolase [[Mycoplasma] testudinis]|uniref:Cof-type HAD-IIB family hydrolase n=1 Tax=[Mycoplasma] testudinis TaxID=33924 RepID=UPI00048040CF|nr:Cof-type HAD-IIB family hydrolase [[Mycoplasma] testudinis]